jgi:hypothetical protein
MPACSKLSVPSLNAAVRRQMAKVVLAMSVLTCALVSSCATFPKSQYCRLTKLQYDLLVRNLVPILDKVETTSVRYEPLIFKNRYIYKQNDTCWCLLSPKSKDSKYGILDGELSVDIDMPAVRISDPKQIVY